MSSEFDWRIEHETLPPDGQWRPNADSGEGLWRPPSWFWLLVAMLVALLTGFGYLWQLGGQADLPPEPELPVSKLEAAVQMEIGALLAGDAELVAQLRSNVDPESPFIQPPDRAWFEAQADAGRTPNLELIDVGITSPGVSRATVRMDWDGEDYLLDWTYQLTHGRWRRDDARLYLESPLMQHRSDHFEINYRDRGHAEVEQISQGLELFVNELCGLLPCPSAWVARLWLDRYSSNYYVEQMAPFLYRMPSPRNIRWPSDGGLEPLVAGSLGRRVAYDLIVRPGAEGLDTEAQTALTMALCWLVHDLQVLDQLPATGWLSAAAEEEGRDAAVRYLSALVRGLSHDHALNLAFGPETVFAVTARPDYFGWLVAIGDGQSPASVAGPPAQYWVDLLKRYDQGADPWIPAGRRFAGTGPELAHVRHWRDWVIAWTATNRGWATLNTFRESGGRWVHSDPDGSLLGEKRTMQVGEYVVSYLDSGDSIAIQTLTTPTATGRITFSVVGMNPTDPYDFTLVPLPEWSPPPPDEPNRLVVRLLQPFSSWEWEAPSSDHRLLVGLNVVQSLLDRTGPAFKPEARYLANGFLAWQIEQLNGEPDVSHWWSGDWRPPAAVDDARWYPLADLWAASVWTEGQQYIPRRQVAAWLAEARLLVAYLIDVYGVELVPSMLQALQRADSMDEWLMSVVGQRARAFEPMWRLWVTDHAPPETEVSIQAL